MEIQVGAKFGNAIQFWKVSNFRRDNIKSPHKEIFTELKESAKNRKTDKLPEDFKTITIHMTKEKLKAASVL